MADQIGLFKTQGAWLDKKLGRLIKPDSWLAKEFLMIHGEDEFLKKGIRVLSDPEALNAQKWGWLRWWKALKIIPAPIRKGMAKVAQHVKDEVPVLKHLPTMLKFGAVLSVFGLITGGVTSAIQGFMNTQGDTGEKLMGAASQSAQSMGRSAGVLAASSAAALFLPKLLFGLTKVTPASVILSQVFYSVAENFAAKWFDKALPKTAPAETQEKMAQQTALPPSQSGADMVRFMEQLNTSARPDPKKPNPFVAAPFDLPKDDHLDKILKSIAG